MEVCGGQTHSILKHGIDDLLRDSVELIHGPGCPVCVTPAEVIDVAQTLAMRPNTTITSFGDMLRVPGTSQQSLLNVRSQGGNVEVVYSPVDAVRFAASHPERDVVFFAVGFETTAPATALAVLQAEQQGLTNFSMLIAHVRVLPAMELLMQDTDCRIEGFLAAGHVCTVTGFEEYHAFVHKHGIPVVVTGFEPVDLLDGIAVCLEQIEAGRAEISNRYTRMVTPSGNTSAQNVVEKVYEVTDSPWRGLGTISRGGYKLRAQYEHFDARIRFAQHLKQSGSQVCVEQNFTCPSGDVLTGRIKPCDCEAFGKTCTPSTPLGAPMVSSEGACAAYFSYSLSRSDET